MTSMAVREPASHSGQSPSVRTRPYRGESEREGRQRDQHRPPRPHGPRARAIMPLSTDAAGASCPAAIHTKKKKNTPPHIGQRALRRKKGERNRRGRPRLGGGVTRVALPPPLPSPRRGRTCSSPVNASGARYPAGVAEGTSGGAMMEQGQGGAETSQGERTRGCSGSGLGRVEKDRGRRCAARRRPRKATKSVDSCAANFGRSRACDGCIGVQTPLYGIPQADFPGLCPIAPLSRPYRGSGAHFFHPYMEGVLVLVLNIDHIVGGRAHRSPPHESARGRVHSFFGELL